MTVVGNQLVAVNLEGGIGQLTEIDPVTGDVSVIDELDFSVSLAMGLAAHDGELYGSSQQFSDIYRITPGAPSTLIVEDFSLSVSGMDFDSDGTLWALDGALSTKHLIKVNVNDGSTEIVSKNGLIEHGPMAAIAFGSSGRMWAIDGDTDELILIDTVTGTGQSVGVTTGWGNDRSIVGMTAVPAPSSLAVLGLSLMFAQRRRSR